LPEGIKEKRIDFFIKICEFSFIEVSIISAKDKSESTFLKWR